MRWSLAAILVSASLSCGSPGAEVPDLRAFGNEPFWSVTIPTADSIVYGRMGEVDIPFPYEGSEYVEGDSIFVLGPIHDATGQHEIEIRISTQDCQDTMADVVHPMRALVTIDGEELSGCARQDSVAMGEGP
jgi:uncharacterized membrane protein